jgi:hypothetical protein
MAISLSSTEVPNLTILLWKLCNEFIPSCVVKKTMNNRNMPEISVWRKWVSAGTTSCNERG